MGTESDNMSILSQQKDGLARISLVVLAEVKSLVSIEEARVLKKEAQTSKMKVLEQNAESLTQSLMVVSQKLAAFAPPATTLQ